MGKQFLKTSVSHVSALEVSVFLFFFLGKISCNEFLRLSIECSLSCSFSCIWIMYLVIHIFVLIPET